MSDYISSYDPHAKTPSKGDRGTWKVNKSRKTPFSPEHVGLRFAAWDEPGIEVVEVKWNGEEWWIKTRGGIDGECWNDLSVFWEHFVPDREMAR